MKNKIFKNLLTTGLVSTMCLGSIYGINTPYNNFNMVSTSYAATTTDSNYSAKGIVSSNVTIRKGPGTSYDSLGVLKKATQVNIVAKSSNGWYKVEYQNSFGYVYSSYITINSDDDKTDTDTSYSATGVVTVSSLTVRKSPSTSSAKIGTLTKNAKVSIVAKASNGWYKIKFGSSFGYVSNQYVSINSNTNTDTSYTATGVVTVSSLTVRKSPSTSSAKLGSLTKNAKVSIVAKASNGWYKIKFGSSFGYVSNQYISINSNTNTDTSYTATGVVTASSLTVRKSPSTSSAKLGALTKNSKVSIVAKASNGWYKIKFGSSFGYVSNQYVSIKSSSEDVKYPAVGTTTVRLNVRKGASTSYSTLGTLQKGVKVVILSKTSTGWYKIQYNNGYGYVSSDYVNI